MTMTATTCPFCACGCGFFLIRGNSRPVGAAPSETHPVAKGKLCARGWHAHEAPLWGKRLTRPIVRRGGQAEPDSWDRALDYIVSRVREISAAGKVVGVLGSARATNEENYLAGRLARAGLATNHVDFSYRSLCRSLLEGIEEATGSVAHSIRLSDIEASETIVLVEGDLAKTHPRAATAVLRALEAGTRLIVIGPARTQMARLASRFVEAEPGREAEAIRSLETEEWTAPATPAVFLIPPTGRRTDRDSAIALAALAARTGRLAMPGSGFLPLLARSNARGACDMGVAPGRLPGYERIDGRSAAQRMERVWGKPLPLLPGLDAEAMIESVSGLILVADDPGAVLPRGAKARAWLEKMEFLAVLDAFETPAVKAAHVALPIASYAETDGTYTNMEGRVQRVRAAARPPDEARDGWRALAELCARFGAGGEWGSARDVFREIAEAAPGYAQPEANLFDSGWGSALIPEPEWTPFVDRAAPVDGEAPAEFPYALALDGNVDWGSDPFVELSPTLVRDHRSERKLYPNGLLEMNAEDAQTLGVREGWRVKVVSSKGGAVAPVHLSKDLRRGTLLVPYAFRDALAAVFGEDPLAAVKVERS